MLDATQANKMTKQREIDREEWQWQDIDRKIHAAINKEDYYIFYEDIKPSVIERLTKLGYRVSKDYLSIYEINWENR